MIIRTLRRIDNKRIINGLRRDILDPMNEEVPASGTFTLKSPSVRASACESIVSGLVGKDQLLGSVLMHMKHVPIAKFFATFNGCNRELPAAKVSTE